jgi:hypothetical protein
MTESSPLVAIVVGVGLAVLTTRDITSVHRNDGQAQAPTPWFVLAVQLVGLAIVGAALYIAAYSFESGHKLGSDDLKAENLFIAMLVVLIVCLGIRNAWNSVAHAPVTSPWERGLFDRLQPLIGFALAVVMVTFVGLLIDEFLIATSIESRSAIRLLLGTAILVIGLGLVTVVLRLMVSGASSPRAFAQSRHEQRQLLEKVSTDEGSWQMVRITAIGALEPTLSMTATIWVTMRGWYWRSEDGGALARYHKWAANHARLPTPALHSQVVTVFGGRVLLPWRGLRITPITRRWWWIDAWRSHRDQSAPAYDGSRLEYEAGLVFIAHSELRAAGLTVVIEDNPRGGDLRGTRDGQLVTTANGASGGAQHPVRLRARARESRAGWINPPAPPRR